MKLESLMSWVGLLQSLMLSVQDFPIRISVISPFTSPYIVYFLFTIFYCTSVIFLQFPFNFYFLFYTLLFPYKLHTTNKLSTFGFSLSFFNHQTIVPIIHSLIFLFLNFLYYLSNFQSRYLLLYFYFRVYYTSNYIKF